MDAEKAVEPVPDGEAKEHVLLVVESVRLAATALVIQAANYPTIQAFEEEAAMWKRIFRPGSITDQDIVAVRASATLAEGRAKHRDTSSHDATVLLRRAKRLNNLADILAPMALP